MVLVTASLGTLLQNTPVVFLQMAEDESAQIDMLVYADSGSAGTALNFSRVEQLVGADGNCAPRVTVIGDLAASCSFGDSRGGSLSQCQQLLPAVALQIIDSAREQRAGLGRSWSHPVPLPPGHIVIDAATATGLQLQVGDAAYAQFRLQGALVGPTRLTVAGVMTDKEAKGKFSSAERQRSIAVLEMASVPGWLAAEGFDASWAEEHVGSVPAWAEGGGLEQWADKVCSSPK